MNLVIDYGNTRIKAALFEGRRLVQRNVYSTPAGLAADTAFLSKATVCILGSVTAGHEQLSGLPAGVKPLLFTSDTRIPIKNLYRSASTLGSDRLAAAIGAWSLYPGQDTLSIDAGTCVKYNFTNAAGEYLGGAIAPGLQMRARAMHHFTHRLPLVEPNDGFDKLVGTTTEESLLSGVINGIVAETDGMIDAYKKQYPGLKVVLAGGDTAFLAKRLKNSIFAHPDLVLAGLNEILTINS